MKRLDPSDPRQLLAWASSLAPTRERQIAVIRDLLQHARGDEMTPADLAFCRAALRLLAERGAA